MKKSLMALAFALTASSNLFAADIENASANVSMDVGLYASVTGLDDMTLGLRSGYTAGDAGAKYDANDHFNFESNGQVRMTVAMTPLTDGENTITTWSTLDGDPNGNKSLTTTADSTHNASHSFGISATLGNISDQKAGAYSSTVSVTVSAL